MAQSFEFYQDGALVSDVDMVYNSGGQRVIKKAFQAENQKIKGTAYLGNDLILENEDVENGTYSPKYVNITVDSIVEGRIDFASKSVSYYIKDHLGSTPSVLSDDGHSVENTMYDSYGKEDSFDRGTEYFREKFTGKELDADGAVDGVTAGIQLTYFGSRYYNPEVGVWASVDPAEKYKKYFL